MRQAPLLYLLIPFSAGIVLALSHPLAPGPVALLAAGTLAAMLLTTFVPTVRDTSHRLFQVLLVLFFGSLGILTTQLRDPFADPQHYLHHTQVDGRYRLQLLVDDTPVERARSYRVRAQVLQVGNADSTVQTCGQVMLYLHKDSCAATLRYGDVLEAEGRLRLPQTATPSFPFDYRKYLLRKGIARQCWLEQDCWQVVNRRPGGLVGWSKALQRRLVERLQQSALPHTQQGIAEALLLGWRGDLEEETMARFRDAGILHLLCVSGLHVGIVAALIGLACRPLRRRWGQVATGLLQLGGIWLFVAVTGMAPATLRSGIMFSLFVLARVFERQNNSFNTLAAAALLMLCIQPTLLADTGFQLSFSAVFGIVLMYRPLYSLIPFRNYYQVRTFSAVAKHSAYRLWQLACLSTAAQLGSLPFSLYHFQQVHPYFLIANITVVPMAGLLVATTLLLVITVTLPVVAQAVTGLLSLELGIVDAVTRWVQRLPGATVDNLYCDNVTAALAAAWVATLALLLRHRERFKRDER